MKNPDTGIARWFSAFGFSLSGLKIAYRSEAAFRQEVWLAVFLIPVALLIGDTVLQSSLLIASVFLLLIVELLNSAIEKVVDRIGDEFHELSGAAKDIGSAAVFLTMVAVSIVWLGAVFS